MKKRETKKVTPERLQQFGSLRAAVDHQRGREQQSF
jgi:hypothetical protein